MDVSVTLGVITKKALELLLTNKNGRKFLGYVIGITLFLLLLPMIAVVGLFGWTSEASSISLDGEQIIAQLPADKQEQIKGIDTVCKTIPAQFTEQGLTSSDSEKAKMLYLAYLVPHDFYNDLYLDIAWCFNNVSNTVSVYDNLSSKFHITITDKEQQWFDEKYGITRKNSMDISGFTDASSKNSKDLVIWAVTAFEQDWGYVYGTYGTVLDEKMLTAKIHQYPDLVGGNEAFIRQHWLGGRTADCVGLIKGYGWYNPETQEIKYGTNGMQDVSANDMFRNASEKGVISTIPEIPGLAVWHDGHIGIYIGNGEVIQAANTKVGVIKTKLSSTRWTHWLKIPYIKYE